MTKAIARLPKGRPTDYSDELADVICERMVTGKSIRKISEMEDMPCEDTIYTWLAKHSYFSEKYRVAAEHRTNRFMEECVDLSDNMPDGIMFIGLDGRLYERIEVLQLTVRERAEAGLSPIGLTVELIGKRKLQIETRMKASAQMNPRKYGPRMTTTLTGDETAPAVITLKIDNS